MIALNSNFIRASSGFFTCQLFVSCLVSSPGVGSGRVTSIHSIINARNLTGRISQDFNSPIFFNLKRGDRLSYECGIDFSSYSQTSVVIWARVLREFECKVRQILTLVLSCATTVKTEVKTFVANYTSGVLFICFAWVSTVHPPFGSKVSGFVDVRFLVFFVLVTNVGLNFYCFHLNFIWPKYIYLYIDMLWLFYIELQYPGFICKP